MDCRAVAIAGGTRSAGSRANRQQGNLAAIAHRTSKHRGRDGNRNVGGEHLQG
jgi:hypothetical protein